jgi:hypothetical protein
VTTSTGSLSERRLLASDWPGTPAYRAAVDGWLAAIPDGEHRRDLLGRMASEDDEAHYSARMEIVLDGMFRSRGWQVDYHPAMPQTTARPDFLVTTPTGRFICEALLVPESDAGRRREQEMHRVVASLRSLRGPYQVWLEMPTPLPGGYPLRRMRAFLARELAVPSAAATGTGSRLLFEDRWRGQAVRLALTVTGHAGDTDGGVSFAWHARPAGPITFYTRLRDCLDEKLDRYGHLRSRRGNASLPYLIVAWADAPLPLSDFQIEQALLGDMKPLIWTVEPGPPRMLPPRRAANGAFTRRTTNGPAHGHVSAVAFFDSGFSAEGIAPHLRIFHNPHARRPLSRRHFSGDPQWVRRLGRDGQARMRWIDNRLSGSQG